MALFGKKVDIELRPTKNAFLPGERLTVRVTIHARKDVEVQESYVELGYKFSYCYSALGNRRGLTIAHDDVIVQKTPLLSANRLEAGTTFERGIELPIPTSAPASGEGKLTRVHWNLRAVLSLRQGSDIDADCPITVLCSPETGADWAEKEGTSDTGGCSISFSVANRNVRAGQSVGGTLRVRSTSDLDAHEVRVDLVRKETVSYGEGLDYESVEGHTQVAKGTHFQPHVPQEFRFSLTVPREVCPTISTDTSELWWELRAVVARRLQKDYSASLPLNVYNGDPLPGGVPLSSRSAEVLPVAVWEWGPDEEGEPPVASPTGVAVDPQGRVYLSDAENGLVFQISAAGEILDALGEANEESRDFVTPGHMAVDAEGNVYVAELFFEQIEKASPDGEVLDVWGPEDEDDDMCPGGVAVDSQGNVYALDMTDTRVWKFSPSGDLLTVLGEPWNGGDTKDTRPPGIAVDPGGALYVANQSKGCIEKLSPTGEIVARWGRAGSAPGDFRRPGGLALDAQGNLYVADIDNHRIQKLSSSGEVLAVWGSKGSQPGRFRYPTGVALDGDERVYVADSGNCRIQIFDASAITSSFVE